MSFGGFQEFLKFQRSCPTQFKDRWRLLQTESAFPSTALEDEFTYPTEYLDADNEFAVPYP